MSCGFKKIDRKNNNTINIQNINIAGEQRIAFKLKNNISLIYNKKSENTYNAEIQIEKNKISKIKDKTGKTTRYNLSVSANLELINLKDNTKISRVFERSSNYQVAAIHSDTINNENNAVKNIIEQLSEDIRTFITIGLRN